MVGSVGVPGAEFEVSVPSDEFNWRSASLPEDFAAVVLAENVAGKEIVDTIFPHAVTEPEGGGENTSEREAYMANVLAIYESSITERTKHHLGFPFNLDFDYGVLWSLQNFYINNCGDPFIESSYAVHSRQFEVSVLEWFARLWGIENHEYWGYITNGGTEGNFQGILLGREAFPDGILYASEDSHYSVFKAARMYRMKCVKVNTLISGEIDYADFKAKLLRNKNNPAIVNVNIGTTVKGGVDNLDLAPKISFKKPIGSISVFGHKFVGCPMPCGVQITRLSHIYALSRDVEYIGSRDATITGGPSGHAPIYLWYALNHKGYRGIQKEVQICLTNAQYLRDRLRAEGIGAMLNEFSNIVVFERPQNEELIQKWQLACQGNIAHIVVMPNVTIEKLDDFLNDLIEKRSTWSGKGKVQAFCISVDIGKENCACQRHSEGV
ncbi:hypothetical protein C5167_032936 [Papaver somniferum]|uniref:Serine decarboxylase n=1 Tax=Papaver somniferum TaxID=3469 RepID=A0A4Y7K9Y5_PAPSO|nr:hypothetical protein C5167_032936 [Papaver somniferum]